MIRYEIVKYAENKLMMTRFEPMDPPIQGIPPYHTSTIFFEESDIPNIINVLSDYHNGKTE